MPSPGSRKGYALDWSTPLRYVATALETARTTTGRAVSRTELTDNYTMQNPTDLSRVKRNEGLPGEDAARAFLIAWVIDEALVAYIREDDEGIRLTVPLEAARYDGEPILPFVDDTMRFRDPFNALTGAWAADNIRQGRAEEKKSKELEELRASMRAFGWLEHHPAIKDERGVVIVGHRRLQVAQELGNIPIREGHEFIVMPFGSGDNADARRLQYALGSNLGGKPLTPGDRQQIAEHLLNGLGWDIARVADALQVSERTVYRDAETLPRVKVKEGRPRKDPLTPGVTPPPPIKAFSEEEVAGIGRDYQNGQTAAQIAKAREVSERSVYRAIDQTAAAAVAAGTEPTLTPGEGAAPVCPTCGRPYP